MVDINSNWDAKGVLLSLIKLTEDRYYNAILHVETGKFVSLDGGKLTTPGHGETKNIITTVQDLIDTVLSDPGQYPAKDIIDAFQELHNNRSVFINRGSRITLQTAEDIEAMEKERICSTFTQIDKKEELYTSAETTSYSEYCLIQ
jgi:hypothetical protein